MTTVAEIVIDAQPEAWRAVGFDVDDTTVQLGGIRIRLDGVDATAGAGLTEWVLADAPDVSIVDIDGLLTSHGAVPPVVRVTQPNGVIGIDHVVVYTPDLERTCESLAAATGAPLKRIREAGAIRQGFHRLGELIVEVVTFPQIDAVHAAFWGLALNVSDIDAIFDRCGDGLMSPPKQAVQPGRWIASFRKEAALGLPVAVMSLATPRR